MNIKTFRCSCIGGTHYISIYYFKDEPEVYFELIDDVCRFSFWKRLTEAFKILFGRSEVCLDSIIFKPEQTQELIQFLQEKHNGCD